MPRTFDIICSVCGSKEWEGGGGQYSADLQQTNYKCSNCDAGYGMIIQKGSYVLHISYAETTSEAVHAWLNGYVLPDMRAHEAKCEETLGLEAPFPPRLPKIDRFSVHMVRKGEDGTLYLDRVTKENSQDRDPEDPIRIRNDKFWKDVMTEVSSETGTEILYGYVPNQYFDDRNMSEPWICFQAGRSFFTAGARKRVINITVKTSGLYMDQYEEVKAKISEMGNRDNTSHGDYNSIERDGTQKHYIHAWGKTKTVEYLVALVKASL